MSFLDGELDYNEMVEKGVAATRQLAKRQLTWLRSWPGINWLDSLDSELPENTLSIIRQQLNL